MQRRVEGLEQRCLLTVQAGLVPTADWFAPVHAADPANSAGTVSGANGGFRAVSGDAIVGTWIVQLSPESLKTIGSPSAADAVLDGYGADFTVLRGLGLPGQILVQASLSTRDRAAAALRSHPLVSMFEPDTYVIGPQSIERLIPTDTNFNKLVGLADDSQTDGFSGSDIDAPEAWSFVDSKQAGTAQVGSRKVVVGVIDSGMDYTHPDLVHNVFLNQGEIPAAIRAALVDTDGDGLITFVDLNDSRNETARQVSSANAVSLIDGADLLADPDWANGHDNDNNGFVDDLIGWDFSNAQFDANGVVVENQKGDNNPGLDVNNGGSDSLHRHGTHVAGTIGAVGNNNIGVTGVSWAVSLLPLRFLDENNQGATSKAILAINYARMMKDKYLKTLTDADSTNDGKLGANIRVTNNSWGGSSNASPVLREAIAAEGAVDILFVAAAGNGNALGRGNDNDLQPFYPASYELTNIVSVAAVDARDDFIEFSNYGARSVDLAAPGLGIISTVLEGQYGPLDGTSMAAPHVSGVAALIAALSPEADFSEIKAALLSSVDKENPVTHARSGLTNRLSTGGRLNAFNAVKADTIRPRASLRTFDITDTFGAGTQIHQLDVDYTDNVELEPASFSADDVLVTRLETNDTFPVAKFQAPNQTSLVSKPVSYFINAPDGAWDAADNGTYVVSLRGDQVRDKSGNFALARTLGSFRVRVSNIGQLAVTSTADAVDADPGNPGSGFDGVADSQGRKTLRAAIMEANAQAGENTIVVPAGEYRLTLTGAGEDSSSQGDLDIIASGGALTIVGASDGRTIIDASKLDRVFDVRPGASLTLKNLTITGGLTPAGQHGGGIRNAGSLTLMNVTINGNVTNGDGGAFANAAGSTAVVSNSTLSGNQAGRGGAIFDGGILTLLNVTIAANTATTGGGVFSDTGATTTAKNSLIATNTAATGPDLAGTFVSAGNNLIGKSNGSTGFTRDVSGNKVGTTEQPFDPLLGPLQDNGGPTFTHDLLRGSQAINAGINIGAPITDQRGFIRLTSGDNHVDIGAVEQVFASISGIKFHDLNANGVQDQGEQGLKDFIVFLDLNHNGLRETTEPFRKTAEDGSYVFTQLLPGTYDVLEEQLDGYEQTSPLMLKFATPTPLIPGGGPVAVATADFNGDNKPDIAVADAFHNVDIFINTGLGTFLAPIKVDLPPTAVPTAIIAADFNGDSRVDLVVASNVTNTVTLLRNQGGNNFVLGTPQSVGAKPTSLTAGRLNADSALDLIVTNGDAHNVQVLLNNGSGNFSVSSPLTLSSAPSASALADFDQDNDLDLVVAISAPNSLTFYENSGSGTFTVGETINSGGLSPSALTSADFNADGFVDLAVANKAQTAGSSVAVFLNRGDAKFPDTNAFLSPVTFAGGATPVALNAADIDGDGALDLVVLNQSTKKLSILLNTRETSAGTTSGQSNDSDFGDAPDTSAGTGVGNYQTLLANAGASHVISTTQTTLFLGARVDGESDATQNTRAIGDDITTLPDDEDGLIEPAQDLILTVGATPKVRVRATNTTGSAATLYGWIDFNRDGVFDNSTERTMVAVPAATSGGRFNLTFLAVPTSTAAGTTYIRLRLSSDAAAANATGAAVGGEVEDHVATIIRRSDGTVDGTKSKKIANGLNGGPTLGSDLFGGSIASLGDLNGDGVSDLAVGAVDDDTGGPNRGAVYVQFMNSNGTVKSSKKIASGMSGCPVVADYDLFGRSMASLGDLDGDGVNDLVVGAERDDAGGQDSGAVHLLLLTANGTVKSSIKIAGGTNGGPTLAAGDRFGHSVASLGDLDGDGVTELAVGTYFDDTGGTNRGAVYVLFINSNGTVRSSNKIASGTNGGPTLGNGDLFGVSTASLGDMNGDGITDLAVGAYRDDINGTDRGAVYVLCMNANGTVQTSTRIGSGANGGPLLANGDVFGASLASMGDLDGDGVTDLAVAAYQDDTGGADRGAIHILSLNANGTVKSSAKLASGTNGGPTLVNSDKFGIGLASAGDIDGDGLTDLAVGVLDAAGGSDRGAVHVLFLNPSTDFGDAPDTSSGTGTGNYQTLLANNGPSHEIALTRSTLFLGARVDGEANATPNTQANGDDTTTSDDEDGLIEPAQDLLVTVGSAPVVRVRATNNTGSTATLYGWIDFNRDGVFDNATERTFVTVPNGTNNGTFRLTFPTILSSTTAGATYARFRLSSDVAAADSTGAAVGGEVEDYVATISYRSDSTVNSAKTVKIASGTTNLPTLGDDARFGIRMANLGDLNGDGTTDLAVVVPNDDTGGTDAGALYVLFMNSNGTIKESKILASGVGGGLAGVSIRGSVANLGDVNGDGVIDLAVGAAGDSQGGSGTGAVYVLFLTTSGTVASSKKIYSGNNGGPTVQVDDFFGASVTSLGDLDGDSVPDMAVGALFGDSQSVTDTGAVYVLFMNSDGTVKSSQTKKISGGNGGLPAGALGSAGALAANDAFGAHVASLGDLNGDGVTDLMVGANSRDTGGNGFGSAFVLFLNSNGTVQSYKEIAHNLSGGPTLPGAGVFGTSLANLSDLDGDGLPEIAVGGEEDNTGGQERGAVWVLSMKSDGTVKGFTKLADNTNGGPTLGNTGRFGRSMTSLGDLDGDGLTELAVGAVYDDTGGGNNKGALYLLSFNPATDFGDAPDTTSGTGTGNYQTLVANGGPSHDIGLTKFTLYLGGRVDGESNAAANARANGDDSTTSDDEDGVIEPDRDLVLMVGTTPKVRVRATNTTGSAATLYGWIDFNRDGVFDNSTEQTSVTVPNATSNGAFTLTFLTIPLSTAAGSTYARFRLSTDVAAANATGAAVGGEVEDYVATMQHRTDGTTTGAKNRRIGHLSNGGPDLVDRDDFGFAVAGIGDLNQDGVSDLAVTAIRDDANGKTNTGAVYIQFMNSDGTVKSNQTKLIGDNTNSTLSLTNNNYFGSSIASLGDLDGDGVGDIVVGVHVENALYVLLMNSNGSVKSHLKLAPGSNGLPSLATIGADAGFGRSVAAIGDRDGDGITDLAVGSIDDSYGLNRGAAYLLSMNSNGTVKSSVKLGSGMNGMPDFANGDYLGRAVASLGDVDGDGIGDLAIGGYNDLATGAVADEGIVYVLLLNANGTVKSSTKIRGGVGGMTALGSDDRFGSAITGLSDVNGDGIPDMAVGARNDDTGGSNTGVIYVLTLNANGTVKSSVKLAQGVNGVSSLGTGGNFGAGVSPLGDLDGDGLPELAVGAREDAISGSMRGAVQILYLNGGTDFGDAPDTTAATGTADYQTTAANNGPSHATFTTRTTLFLGSGVDGAVSATPNVAAAGDDLVSSAATDDENGVFEPREDLVLTVGTAPVVRVRATNTSGAAATLYGWIDFNRDGVFDNSTEWTSATVPNSTSNFTFNLTFPTIPVSTVAGATYARFRLSTDVAAANSTGAAVGGEVEDFTATITKRSDGTVNSAKTVEIFSVTNGGPALANSDRFGSSGASLGDLDGDGTIEVAVGARGVNSGRGAVYVLSLNADGTAKNNVKLASGENGVPTLGVTDYFGTSVASLGDLDGDGVTDVAVGTHGDDTNGTDGIASDRGAVYVLLLHANGSVKSHVKIASGTANAPVLANSDGFGWSVTSLGDLDGDGVTDLAVGARGDNARRGAVHVLFLNSTGTVKSSMKIASGTANVPTLSSDDYFGHSVASLGDQDGDGVTDIAVGSKHDDTGGFNRGAVHVLRLNSNGTVKSNQKIAHNTNGPSLTDSDFFGTSITSVGDVDGDGVTDIAVGAVGENSGGADRGAVYVVLLNANGTAKSTVKLSSSANGVPMLADGDYFGWSVASLGDLDGDGLPELAVGASMDDNGAGTNHGAAYVLFFNRLNEAPIFTSPSNVSIVENSTAVVSLTATDINLDSVSFSVVGGADAAKFQISSGNLQFKAAPNFESPTDSNSDNIYQVQVQASDGRGGIATQTISVTVSDTNEFDPVLLNTSLNVAENAPDGTLVGTVTATDTDTPNALTYAITAGNSLGIFAINPVTGAISVSNRTNLNGSLGSVPLTVRVTDGGPGASRTTDATITINIAGFRVVQPDGSTVVNESGTTDTVTVVLTSQPLANVVLSVTSNNTLESTVSPATLTFTSANWSIPQTITVTGANDVQVDGPQDSIITVSVVDASSDNAFDSLADQTVTVTTIDNDKAGFTVTQSGGGTTVSEAGTTDTFQVALDQQPTSNVVFSVSASDASEATVSASLLTFTPANWNVPQTVTVTGVDDDVIDGPQNSTITLSVVDGSSDNSFDPLPDQIVTVSTNNNDFAGFTIGESGGGTSVSETGTTDTFTVVLNAQPGSNVVLAVTSNDTGEATVSVAALTFTTANWNVAQTVTVTGIDDTLVDGLQNSSITLNVVDESSDNDFDPIADQTVIVSTSDNELAGFTIAVSGGSTTVSESGTTDTFTVVLNGQPVSDVVLSVTSGATDEAAVSPATLTFTTANWNIAQTVTVTGVSDGIIDGTQNSLITVSVVDASSANTFDPVPDQTVPVSIADHVVLIVNTPLDMPDLMPGDGVVNTGVANDVTLRAAIMELNVAPAGTREIVIPAGTYTLTRSGPSEELAMTGDLDVTSGSLVIRGAGAGQTILDAGGLDRLFDVRNSGVTLSLIGLALRNGDLPAQDGGAIDNRGALTITDSEFSANSARTGGAIFLRDGSSATVSQTTFVNNTSIGASGLGGAIATLPGTGTPLPIPISITSSAFINNRAVFGGGAIYTASGAVINRSLFSSNQVIAAAANGLALGGAVFSDDGTALTIIDSSFTQNVVRTSGTSGQANGGAVSADDGSLVFISGSSFDHNQAVGSGGTLNRIGGALSLRGNADIANSTFSGNSADTDGGGISHQIGTLSLNHVTVAENHAARSGGGISVVSGTARLRNTLIATNTATTSNRDVNGAFVSDGHNLIGLVGSATGLTDGDNGNLVGTSAAIDPLLGPLANNGGPTVGPSTGNGGSPLTHSLRVTQVDEKLTYSKAIDAGDPGVPLPEDQRGFARVLDGNDDGGAVADIGAFELPLNRRPTIAVLPLQVNENSAIGTLVGPTGAFDPDNNLANVTLSGIDSAFFTLDSFGGLLLSKALDFETKSSYSVTVKATDTAGLHRSADFTITVTDLNEAPFVVGSGLDDRVRRDGDAAESVDLRPLFRDVDAGATLIYEVSNSNPALVSAQIVGGNSLSLTYLPYFANQDRTPSKLTVRAIDQGSLVGEDTFEVSVGPRGTLEYALVVTRSVTAQPSLVTLPTSVTSVGRNEDFFVEVWVRDLLDSGRSDYPSSLAVGNATRGILAAGIDLLFDAKLSTTDTASVDASGIFSSAEAENVDVVAGRVNNLQGVSAGTNVETATQFGRLGAVKFRATGDETGLQSFKLVLNGDEPATRRSAIGLGNGIIHPSQIILGKSITVGVDPDGGEGATRLFETTPRIISLPTDSDGPSGLALADFDGNGGIDFVTANRDSNTASVLLNAPGRGHTVTLGAGDAKADIHFGNRALPGEIRGVVFLDTNNNGTQDLTESGLGGWEVYLDLNGNGVFDLDSNGELPGAEPEPKRVTRAVDANNPNDVVGEYVFTNLLSARSYRVGTVLKSGFVRGTPDPTINDGLHVIELQAGQTKTEVNFGVTLDVGGVSGSTGIQGYVFRDADGDEIRDPLEGLAGVKVYLDINDDGDFDIATEPTTTTMSDVEDSENIDEAGFYNFPNKSPGKYRVRVDASGTPGMRQTFPLRNSFTTTRQRVGGDPQGVASGNFDGVGSIDLAVTNQSSSNISLLVGTGTGFTQKDSIGLQLSDNKAFGAFAIVSGKFNNDNLDDLAVVNTYSRNVSVLLNNPNNPGDFAAAVNYPVGTTPRSIIAVDIDGDTHLDLVTANEGDSNISVLKGKGDGTFDELPVNFALGTKPYGLTSANLTGDAKPELIVTLQDDKQVIILNNVAGTFTQGQRLTVGRVPLAVTAADLNGDSQPDLAVSNFLDDTLSVFLNPGSGIFNASQATQTLKADAGPAAIVAVDLDGDRQVDLAVTNNRVFDNKGPDSIHVFKNVGKGQFEPTENAGVAVLDGLGAARFSIVKADVNDDLIPDLVVTDKSADRISIITNTRVAAAQTVQLTAAKNVTEGTNFIFELMNVNSFDPTVSGGPFSIAENSKNGTTVGSVTGADADTANGGLSYSITSGNSLGIFEINSSTGAITVVNQTSLDRETVTSVTLVVEVSDNGPGAARTGSANITINVENVNETPTITGGAGSISVVENNKAVTTIMASDIDTNTTLSYSLSGTDAAKFSIGSNGAISFKAAPNFEVDATSYSFNVIVSDGSLSDTKAVNVSITNANETPAITGGTGSISVVENNKAVTTIVASDVDASTTLSYSLSGTDAAKFNVSSNGAVSFKAAPNFEVDATSYSFNVIVSDGALSDTKAVNVSITNANEAPVITGGAGSLNVVENTTAVTTIVASDVDAKTTLSYSLSGTDAAKFNIGSNGAVSFKVAPVFGVDPTNYSFQATVSDGALSDTKTVNVTVVDDGIADVVINVSTNQKVLVQAASGKLQVLINDAVDPAYANISAAAVRNLTINGGSGDNLIDLRNVTSTAFSRVGGVSVVVNGGAGKDIVFGSSFADQISGGDGDDSLDGGAGNDSLDGGLNNDTLTGGVGVDALVGGNGTDSLVETVSGDLVLNATTLVITISGATTTDTHSGIERGMFTGTDIANRFDASAAAIPVTLSGVGGSDTLLGGSVDDALDGGLGDDSIHGGAGNDTLSGSTGNDSLDGGVGSSDLLSEFSVGNLTLTTKLTSVVGGVTENDTLLNLERAMFSGGGQANKFDAAAASIPVTLQGGSGNDTLIGGTQTDSIDGQGGDDTLTGNSGNDILIGGLGNDAFRDVAYTDVVSGQTRTITLTDTSLIVKQGTTTLSTDSLSGFELADLTGGLMRDVISAATFTNTGVTTISGGGGNDVISGTEGADLIFTLAGADSINGNGGADAILSGNGNDTINGGEGADNLNGQSGNDSLVGDNGNDVLVGGAGIDIMSGGPGNDFLSGQTEASSLTGGDGNDTLQGNTDKDTLNGDVGDDRLYGLQGDDVISGGDGADSLLGATGNDSLSGGAGPDTLQGDLGNDTLDGGADSDRVNEVLDTNLTIVGLTISTTTMGKDSVTAVERIQVSGGASANFFDARLASVPVFLAGAGGSDTLLGGSKADGITGGDGDDVISGGAGADIIDGGDGTDYWLETQDTNFTVNAVTVTSSVTGTETAIGVERIVLIGGISANKLDASLATVPVVLLGGKGNDTLLGGSQADTLSGGNRNDSTVAGSDGVDSLDGGNGADVLENDTADTRVGTGDTLLANVFAQLPSWIDAL